MKKALTILCLLLLRILPCHAQIHFGQYGNYKLSVDELNNDDLNFGKIISGSDGPYEIDINQAKIIAITGVEYLDIIVDVEATSSLYLNGEQKNESNTEKSIPYTLKAAYANNKGTPNITHRKLITNITNNSFIKRFPILERQSQPPGPPPPPSTNAFEQSKIEDTAYLYLYGVITNVGHVNAGHYSSRIVVTINYD